MFSSSDVLYVANASIGFLKSVMRKIKKSRGDPTRTGDHLVPNQVRYQLRYTPCFLLSFSKKPK